MTPASPATPPDRAPDSGSGDEGSDATGPTSDDG